MIHIKPFVSKPFAVTATVIAGLSGLSFAPSARPDGRADNETISAASRVFNDVSKKATPAVVSISAVKPLHGRDLFGGPAGEAGGEPPMGAGPVPGPGGAEPGARALGIGSGIVIRP